MSVSRSQSHNTTEIRSEGRHFLYNQWQASKKSCSREGDDIDFKVPNIFHYGYAFFGLEATQKMLFILACSAFLMSAALQKGVYYTSPSDLFVYCTVYCFWLVVCLPWLLVNLDGKKLGLILGVICRLFAPDIGTLAWAAYKGQSQLMLRGLRLRPMFEPSLGWLSEAGYNVRYGVILACVISCILTIVTNLYHRLLRECQVPCDSVDVDEIAALQEPEIDESPNPQDDEKFESFSRTSSPKRTKDVKLTSSSSPVDTTFVEDTVDAGTTGNALADALKRRVSLLTRRAEVSSNKTLSRRSTNSPKGRHRSPVARTSPDGPLKRRGERHWNKATDETDGLPLRGAAIRKSCMLQGQYQEGVNAKSRLRPWVRRMTGGELGVAIAEARGGNPHGRISSQACCARDAELVPPAAPHVAGRHDSLEMGGFKKRSISLGPVTFDGVENRPVRKETVTMLHRKQSKLDG